MDMLQLSLGLSAFACAFAMAIIGYAAMQGMARQPESIGKMQTAMLIALVFVELIFLLTVFVGAAAFRGN